MLSAEQEKLLEHYNRGLALYKQRKWDEAISEFKQGLISVPEDGPSKLYIDRSKQYKRNPPDADWDGVFVMKTK